MNTRAATTAALCWKSLAEASWWAQLAIKLVVTITEWSLPGPEPQSLGRAGTDLSGQCEDRGHIQRRFTAGLTRTVTPGTRWCGSRGQRKRLMTSSACRDRIASRYCEWRIDLDRTRGNCGDKPELFWWLSVCVQFEWSEYWTEVIKLEELDLRRCTVVFSKYFEFRVLHLQLKLQAVRRLAG